MIKVGCPHCGTSCSFVIANWLIEATGQVRFTPTKDGVTLARDPMTVNFAEMKCTGYQCPQCKEETTIEEWSITIGCDNCGSEVSDPQLICLDTKQLRCYACWLKEDSGYCPKCTYRGSCELAETYQNRKDNVKTKRAVPPDARFIFERVLNIVGTGDQ